MTEIFEFSIVVEVELMLYALNKFFLSDLKLSVKILPQLFSDLLFFLILLLQFFWKLLLGNSNLLQFIV